MRIFGIAIVLVVLLAGVTYVVSTPVRTKVDMQLEQATQWTPRQIERDPAGYLFHNEKRADEAITQLRSALIATSQLTERMIALQIEATSSRDSLIPILNRLREAYKSARNGESWPTIVDGRPFTEADLRKAIIDAHSRLQEQETRVAFSTRHIADLEARSAQIRSKISEVEQLKLKIRSDLELIRANGVADGVQAIQIDVSAFQRVGSLIAGTDATDPVAQMLKNQAELSSDAEFEAILLKE